MTEHKNYSLRIKERLEIYRSQPGVHQIIDNDKLKDERWRSKVIETLIPSKALIEYWREEYEKVRPQTHCVTADGARGDRAGHFRKDLRGFAP